MARRTRTAKATSASEATSEKWRQALELRKAGASFDRIATECGYADRASAYKAVQHALRSIIAEPAEDVRRLELERLDGLYEKALSFVEDHKVLAIDGIGEVVMEVDAKARISAIQAALKVQERRARLLGLDAPVKTQEVAPEKLDDEQLWAEIDKLRAKRSA